MRSAGFIVINTLKIVIHLPEIMIPLSWVRSGDRQRLSNYIFGHRITIDLDVPAAVHSRLCMAQDSSYNVPEKIKNLAYTLKSLSHGLTSSGSKTSTDTVIIKFGSYICVCMYVYIYIYIYIWDWMLHVLAYRLFHYNMRLNAVLQGIHYRTKFTWIPKLSVSKLCLKSTHWNMVPVQSLFPESLDPGQVLDFSSFKKSPRKAFLSKAGW